MLLNKNDEIRLKIDALTNLGSGIGRYKEMAVFVDGTAVGDEIIAHIIKVKKNYAVGKVAKIVKASKDRIVCDCEVASQCGGCAFRHISYEAELREKQQAVSDVMMRIGSVDFPAKEILHIEKPERYRNKAQIPVALSKEGNITVGFYSKRSHRVVASEDCLLQMPQFKNIVSAIKKYIAENPVTIYDESTHKGLIRHIYLRRGRVTGEIMVCLVINGDSAPKKERLIEALTGCGESISSIVLNINKKDTNVVLGDKCITIWGKDYIEDELCSLKFRISPLSFYQVNPEGTEILYGKAREYADLKDNETLLDLYCGAGTIGLTMAKKAKQIIGVEVIPQAIENAKENAEINGITNARFICDDASGAAKTLYCEGIRPNVVVLDPPRKGCSADVLKTVADMNPDRVVYVSCDSATLARDCKIFAELGYAVKEYTAVDMFPRTTHCECVALLVRE
ncbi:MAG: 23S rRNA (uracil(1939)-C(5))-methyltransferase RlmD [Clostridia bacterium]|nr:23S rRNA (uracil(1939)-C(5))-methyltransferase RlmD [Clostridia bacterium]